MEPQNVAKGRRILLVYNLLTLFVSLGVIALYLIHRGTERLPTQLVRLLLTAVLCVGLYRGNRVAKRIAIVLFGVAGGLGFYLILRGGPVEIAIGVVLATLYLSFARALIWSRSMNDFLDWQSNRREVGHD